MKTECWWLNVTLYADSDTAIHLDRLLSALEHNRLVTCVITAEYHTVVLCHALCSAVTHVHWQGMLRCCKDWMAIHLTNTGNVHYLCQCHFFQEHGIYVRKYHIWWFIAKTTLIQKHIYLAPFLYGCGVTAYSISDVLELWEWEMKMPDLWQNDTLI